MQLKAFNTTYNGIFRLGVGIRMRESESKARIHGMQYHNAESQNRIEFGQPKWVGLVMVEAPTLTMFFISRINLMKKLLINLKSHYFSLMNAYLLDFMYN